jgi:hypothetical protein
MKLLVTEEIPILRIDPAIVFDTALQSLVSNDLVDTRSIVVNFLQENWQPAHSLEANLIELRTPFSF